MRKSRENNTFHEREIVRLITCLMITVILAAVFFIAATAVSLFRKPADSDTGTESEALSEQKEQLTDREETSAENTEPEMSGSENEAENINDSAKIHILDEMQLKRIPQEFSSEIYGFGLGLEPETDEDNRPKQVNSLLARFVEKDVMPVCYCADSETPAAAFTFQAGMENGYTQEVLDILDRYQIKSTFYINYSFARKAAGLVRRMIDTDHEIGSHSYSCPDDGIACEPLEDQMTDAMQLQNYVSEHFGYEMKKYNFNSGNWSEASVALMSRMGYEVCFCSSNYSDYFTDKQYDTEKVLTDLKNNLHNGCVYCFHMTNPITAQILPGLIEYCQEQGYSIIQLD